LALAPGARLGVYDITAQIGEGGMGQVYRATDTKLKRQVAIKILSPWLAADHDRLARFQREAEVLASLNHPHIAGIYGLEESGGMTALVMELVEGEDLAQRIARGAIPLDEALPIAKQIAEALEAAHEQGIIHRDLKPANIKIRDDGTVKVLDFGLAKALRASDPRQLTPPPGVSQSPTTSTPAAMTGVGVVLGTAAYMSPEQARGLPLDRRCDIWSLGCVLFEMLTGRRAFTGAADAVGREPEWNALPSDLPESIHRLIRRCLEKDSRNRLHDVADARIEITDALSSPARSEQPRTSSIRSSRLIAILAAMPLVALTAYAGWSLLRHPVPARRSAQMSEFGVTFPNNFMPTDGVAISPDGRHIAANVWSDSGNIWVHSFDGTQPHPLNGGELASRPFWSPDSSTIAFFQGGQIVTMPANGGSRTVIAKIQQSGAVDLTARTVGGSWNRDNVIIFSAGGKLFRVAVSAASPPAELPVTGVGGVLTAPTFLPDGRHFVFCADDESGGQLNLASLDDYRARALGASECPGGFAPPDRVLFVRRGSVLAQRLDMSTFALRGEPQVVASNINRGAVGPWPQLTLSASDTGTLALPAPRGGSSLGKLTWFDREGRSIGTIEPPLADVEYLNPAICPTNDNLVAANRLEPETGSWHVWLIDAARGNAASRLTTNQESDVDPVWSSDGKEIMYMADRDGRRGFYRQPVDGGPATQVLDVGQFQYPMPSDWSGDGHVLFSNLQQSVWAFRLGDRTPVQVQQRNSYGAHLSPDGRWLAYTASDGGSFKLFVERFPGGFPRKPISTGTGVHPRWINGGKSIAYWVPPGGIVSTDLVTSDQEIRLGTTRTLVSQPVLNLIDARTHYDITSDGRKILVRQQAGAPTPGIRLIVDWLDQIDTRAPIK